MTKAITLIALLILASVAPAAGQVRLTLDEAVARARKQHTDVRVAHLQTKAADERARRARAEYWPQVDFSEGWQWGNQPVFAFSTLLSQRRFSAADFDVAKLNYPDAVDNFRSAVVVEQRIFDASRSASVQAADLGRDVAVLQGEQTAQTLAVQTVEAYGRVLLLDALGTASDAAVALAEADLQRAEARRDVGVATDADVLSIAAHLAAVRERRLQAVSEAGVARARLNHLMGEPLDAAFTLESVTTPVSSGEPVAPVTDEVLSRRPDVRLAIAGVKVADAHIESARASFFPQVVARGGTDWNGATFGSRANAWILGAEVRFNLFGGFANRARLAEARAMREVRDLERVAVEDRARIEILAATTRLSVADARIDLARAAVASARESQRITRDRYENGLADVSMLLAGARAVLDAEAQAVAAEVDRAVEQARLRAAVGQL